MANGFAHSGLVLLFLASTNGVQAMMVEDLVISEVMVNPAAVADIYGEWFELYNPTAQIIDLGDLTLTDDGRDHHRLERNLTILPGDFLTFARNGDANVNGGFNADYVYDNFSLSNAGDEIIFSLNTITLLRLDYGSDFGVAGRSRELTALPMQLDNFDLSALDLVYGDGDLGSPGLVGGTLLGVAPVPLPSTAWLFAGGVMLLVSKRFAGRRADSGTQSR